MDIFVSYNRADQDRVGFLVDMLEGHGINVWWDENLVAGSDFHNDIQGAINAADVVIVVWTSQSITSNWVRAEASAGFDQQKLLPVLMETVSPPVPFNNIDCVDMVTWPDHARLEHIQKMWEAIGDLTGGSVELAMAPAAEKQNFSQRIARRIVDAINDPRAPPLSEMMALRLTEADYGGYREGQALANLMEEGTLAEAIQLVAGLSDDKTQHMLHRWRAYHATTSDSAPEYALAEPETLTRELLAEMHTANSDSIIKLVVSVLLPLGRYNLARIYLDVFMPSEPFNPEGLFHYARSLAYGENWDSAFEKLMQALDRAPKSGLLLVYAALFSALAGDQKASRGLMQRFIKLPGHEALKPLVSKCLVAPDFGDTASLVFNEVEQRLVAHLAPTWSPGDSEVDEIDSKARMLIIPFQKPGLT